MQISLLTLKSFIFNIFILILTLQDITMDGGKLEAQLLSKSKRKRTVKKIFQLIDEPDPEICEKDIPIDEPDPLNDK